MNDGNSSGDENISITSRTIFTPNVDLSIEGYSEDEFLGHDIELAPPENQQDDEPEYLHNEDRETLDQQKSSWNPEDWSDRSVSTQGEKCIFVLDRAARNAWKSCKEEIEYLRTHLHSILNVPLTEKIGLDDLISLAFGQQSNFTTSFCNELKLDNDTFMRFIGTVCLQMSYRECPSAMYDEKYSQLKDKVLMSKMKYMNIWSDIAKKRKVFIHNFVGMSRREKCIWEICEESVNHILRSVSIAGRTEDISIALDDDKIWVENTGQNAFDQFGLRKVTHVKDNRKGIVAHTAVSSSTNVPLSFVFEREGNNATQCFTALFGRMFPSRGHDLPNLCGVKNHSDRGYTIEKTVFEFLIPAGADFNNTVKRIAPFPCVWGMKVHDSDKRTVLKEKGAPTLYIKEIMNSGRLVTYTAFRTGTKNISAVVSTTTHGHCWEGISLNPKQVNAYNEDPDHGLDSLIFEKIASLSDEDVSEHEMEIKELFDNLRDEKINVVTLTQGTADWFKARQFSFTSSQSHGSFDKALIIYQDDDDWCNVARYVSGATYHNRKWNNCSFLFFKTIILKNRFIYFVCFYSRLSRCSCKSSSSSSK